MITEVNEKYVIQHCPCGAENKVDYKSIQHDPKIGAFKLPSCLECKTRIEFVFTTCKMTYEESKLFYEMFSKGYLNGTV